MDINMATNKPKRKTYSDEYKEFLVQEAEISGRSIASIARDNGLNQNLLHNWKREHKGKQPQTDRLPARIDNNASTNNSTFIPINVTPEPNPEQITDFITSRSSVLTGIELQIPTHNNSHNAKPIKLSIAQIDTHSLLELLRGLQWTDLLIPNKSGYRSPPWTCEVAVINYSPLSYSTTQASAQTVPTYFTTKQAPG